MLDETGSSSTTQQRSLALIDPGPYLRRGRRMRARLFRVCLRRAVRWLTQPLRAARWWARLVVSGSATPSIWLGRKWRWNAATTVAVSGS